MVFQEAASLVLLRSILPAERQQFEFCMDAFGDDKNRLIRLEFRRFRHGNIYYRAQDNPHGIQGDSDLAGARVGDEWTIRNYQGHNAMPVDRPFYGWFPNHPETIRQTRDYKPVHKARKQSLSYPVHI